MKKKSLRKAKRNKSFLVKQKNIVVIFTSVLFLLLAAVIFKQNSPSPSNFCANSISCIKNLSGTYEEGTTLAKFMGQTIDAPKELAQIPPLANVLGNTTGQKRIEIDLSTQHLYAYEGTNLIYDFLVSTGKWSPTPTGSFRTWIKLRYTRMTGGNKAWGTYYNLPNVPYTMYFYNDTFPKTQGYGIHGAYWHNNFGHPMSHGCVNMRIEDVEKLYNWADPPTKGYTTYADNDSPGALVIIYGETPKE